MTYIITETSRYSGLQVASLAKIGCAASEVILIFDRINRGNSDEATAVALLPGGRRFINRALRLDPREEGQKWTATKSAAQPRSSKPGDFTVPPEKASKVNYVKASAQILTQVFNDLRHGWPGVEITSYEPGSEEYSLLEGKGIGTWYLIGLGEGGKAWQELPEGSSDKRIDGNLLEMNLPVEITCREHGGFMVTPNDFLGKNTEKIAYGCPDCGDKKQLEK